MAYNNNSYGGYNRGYTQFMLGAQTDLYRFLTTECCLSLNDIRAVSRYSIAAADALDADHSLKEINAFVRGADGRVYVPGSSVKCALRTAILTDWILSDNSPHSAFGDTRKGFPEGTYLHTLKLKKDWNDVVLDDAVNSILRGLSISDSLPVSDTCMILAGKTDADPNGQTHRINLCRECIRPGTKLHFKLTLDQSVLHQKITAEGLMRSIRTFDSFYERPICAILQRRVMRQKFPMTTRSFWAAAWASFPKRLHIRTSAKRTDCKRQSTS